MRNTPYKATQNVKADLGIYAQDAWTMKRLTLNYGGRYDHFNSYVPAQDLGSNGLAAVRPRFQGDRERARGPDVRAQRHEAHVLSRHRHVWKPRLGRMPQLALGRSSGPF